MSPVPSRELRDLRRLSRLCGVQTSYYDIRSRRTVPPPDTLLAVLKALGNPLETFRDATAALRTAETCAWDRFCPPACVAWNGAPAELELRLPASFDGSVRLHASVEGAEKVAECDLSRIPATGSGNGLKGVRVAKRVQLPWSLPPGYHDIRIEARGESGSTTVISAPARTWAPSGDVPREWGVFLPLYALHSARSPGAGDLTDLRALMDWVEEIGGDAVGTLPLLASCSPEPFNPSPYAPGSRLAWNEFYLDASRAPGFGECRPARERFSSEEYRAEADRLRNVPLVDFRRGMEWKRRLLRELAGSFFSGGGDATDGFRRFLAENPFMEDYATFRAAWDARGSPWPVWPDPSRDGVLREGDFEEADRRYHLFVQWALHLQLGELAGGSRVRLYLDLPLGTSYDGYDVWRFRNLFALRASTGAPPDDFFTKGQDWGFPPLHPERIREDGHAYFRACIANQLRYAGILRIDHVMGLHRFFWIPGGAGPSEGTYVRYPAEELYAVLCLESHRHRARIVGEDLGTVPPYVRPAMGKHGLRRMFVVQYGAKPDPGAAIGKIPNAAIACVNTHDMPPFASFRKGLDVDDRVALGLLDARDAAAEKDARRNLVESLTAFLRRKGRLPRNGAAPDTGTLLRACLAHLAGSGAEMLIVGLEDLWQEENPQNTPGTSSERPNWVRKSRYSFERFRELPEVNGALREIAQIRKGGGTA